MHNFTFMELNKIMKNVVNNKFLNLSMKRIYDQILHNEKYYDTKF